MTTTNTSTIGTSSRTYSTIASWEDATDNDLVSGDVVEVGECYNDSEFTPASQISFAGATVDSTRYRKLTAATGHSFADHANKLTNALKYNQSVGVGVTGTFGYASGVLYINENYFVVERLQIKATHAVDTGGIRNDSDVTTIKDCIIEANASNSTNGGTLDWRGVGAKKAINLLCRLTGSGRYRIAKFNPGTGAKVLNCTFVADSDLGTPPTYGFQCDYSGFTMQNCAMFGATNLKVGSGTPTYTTCATDLSSPPSGWTGSLTYSSQFEGTASTGPDFRLKSGANLADAGTTDTDAATDIVGTTRSSYDIGCWELASAATVVGPLIGSSHILSNGSLINGRLTL